ncbi:BREX-2 system phosphatase PglZ [Kribbella sindirgiensis]|nr:BREX-2 system phosphatase PglZ [Kribbella sindirgiensis]
MVQQRASDLVKSGMQVLLLRARPEWTHGDVSVGNTWVRVLPGVSQLGILDIYASLEADERVVILTDRPRDDLGDAVLARAYRQQIEVPDEWQAVPRMFPGAREVSRELRRLDWAATALLDHQPPGGWPRSTELALTARHAIGALLANLLGLGANTELDGIVVLTSLGQRDVRRSWASVDERLRRHVIDWASLELGAPAAFALRVAQRQEHISPLAVGLALDVLWPDDGTPVCEEQIAARARVEAYIDGKSIRVEVAQAVAQVAKTVVLRLGLDDSPELGVALQQAEALLGDLDWEKGAERSTILHPGYRARLRALANALDSGKEVEEALAALMDHRDAGTSTAPTMAVRLARWLATNEQTTTSLAQDLQHQMDDGAWVDAAIGAVWNGDADPVVAGAYEALITRVQERRQRRDETAATRLHQARDIGPRGALGIERLLSEIVEPWRHNGGALLVVLDGMSAAIGTALASEVARLGLVEWVPAATHRRLAAVAALPSLTRISRTTLFCGKLCEGGADDEKKGLATAFPGSLVFHKDDLRAEGGAALPDGLLRAMRDNAARVVGVVINAIDDAIHKNDTSGSDWDLHRVEPLRALLVAAADARRVVILTSDHGHVVERDSEALSSPGADARWRLASSGPAAHGEVLVKGPRVIAPDESAVLLWREDAHFGARRAGYHGGASLAEITIPVLVFQAATMSAGVSGWEAAAPQVPTWWNDPVNLVTSSVLPKPRKIQPSEEASKAADQGVLFEVSTTERPAIGLAEAVLASATYAEQKRMAGRRALDDATAAAVIRALLEHGSRAHLDTVAAAAGIPAAGVGQVLAAVRRLLNVDGYAVIEMDADGVTLRIDERLLREQFEIGGAA